jgi:hypothetical protein
MLLIPRRVPVLYLLAFANTPRAANAGAVMFSIIETAKENDLNPFEYLTYWWYIGFCAVMFWLILILIQINDWFLLACAVAAVLAVLVTYTRVPRQLTYRLERQTLTINEQTLHLNNYRAFTIETVRTETDDARTVNAFLLPKRRFGHSLQVTLPEGVDETNSILNAIREFFPFGDAKGYLAGLRFLDRFAHWLRLV